MPIAARNAASSDAIIAIALELEVDGVYFPPYPIAKSSRLRPRTSNSGNKCLACRAVILCWRSAISIT